MAKRIEATIEKLGKASRKFRTTEVTLREVTVSHDGVVETWPEVETQLDVVRALRLPAHGQLYMTDVPGVTPTLFGLRLDGQQPAFDGGNGLGEQIIWLFWLLIGLAFFWTVIGLLFAWWSWKALRVMADAKRARALYNADARAA